MKHGDYAINVHLQHAGRIWCGCGNGWIAWSPYRGFMCWAAAHTRAATDHEIVDIQASWYQKKAGFSIDFQALDELMGRVDGTL